MRSPILEIVKSGKKVGKWECRCMENDKISRQVYDYTYYNNSGEQVKVEILDSCCCESAITHETKNNNTTNTHTSPSSSSSKIP